MKTNYYDVLCLQKSYKNFYEDFSEPVTDFFYKNNCELLLQSEFKMVSHYNNSSPLYILCTLKQLCFWYVCNEFGFLNEIKKIK